MQRNSLRRSLRFTISPVEFQTARTYAQSRLSSQSRQSTGQQLLTRRQIDQRNRSHRLNFMRESGIMGVNVAPAIAMIEDFLNACKNGQDPVVSVTKLAKEYHCKFEDIAYMAVALLRVPDTKVQAALFTSENATIAAQLLFACSAAKNPLATLQILYAVYWSNGDFQDSRKIARLFTRAQIEQCRDVLRTLAGEGNPDALTLQGLFLELEGQKEEAKQHYVEATKRSKVAFDPRYPHPMGLPWVLPWNALADLLSQDKSGNGRASAKAALQRGLEADDPNALKRLAALEDGYTPMWIKYTTKVAASGDVEASYQLGRYYLEAKAHPEKYKKHVDVLSWLWSWGPDGTGQMAKEWFEVAALGGYKPALLSLSEIYHDEGNQSRTLECLKRILEPSKAPGAQQWPRLVLEAQRRLLTAQSTSKGKPQRLKS